MAIKKINILGTTQDVHDARISSVDDELSSSSLGVVKNSAIASALSGKQDTLTAGEGIGITSDVISNTQGIEYIVGTQTAATNLWTGVTTSSSLVAGKIIAYYLPYAGTSSAASLNLTLSNGTTTGAIAIRRQGGSTVTTHIAVDNIIILIYDGTYWKVSAYYYSDTNNVPTGYCTTAAATAAKVATNTYGYRGDSTYIPVVFRYANTASNATLAISSYATTELPIYVNGARTTSSNTFSAGVHLFLYYNSAYYLYNDGRLPIVVDGEVTSVQDYVATKADDSDVVHLAGHEIITGVKGFGEGIYIGSTDIGTQSNDNEDLIIGGNDVIIQSDLTVSGTLTATDSNLGSVHATSIVMGQDVTLTTAESDSVLAVQDLQGGTMRITNVGTPTEDTDATTKAYVDTGLAAKQDTISDLATIRSGAALGATAVQPATLSAGLATKQDALTFDTTPTSGSTNPVTSGGVYDAIEENGVGIESVEQTTTSTADGGTNVVTVTLTDGTTSTIQVKNGNQGNSGYTGAADELEVVNNLTDGGSTAALSAEMGVTLNEKIGWDAYTNTLVDESASVSAGGFTKIFESTVSIAAGETYTMLVSGDAVCSRIVPYVVTASGQSQKSDMTVGTAVSYTADVAITSIKIYVICTTAGDLTFTVTQSVDGTGIVPDITTNAEAIADMQNSFIEYSVLNSNYDFSSNGTGWTLYPGSYFTISNNVLTGALSGTTMPTMSRTISYSAGKRYYVYIKVTPTTLHSDGVVLKARGIVSKDVTLEEGVETVVSGYIDITTDADTLTYIIFYAEGASSGETVIVANMSYFAVIEVDQDTILPNAVLDAICERGSLLVPVYADNTISSSATTRLEKEWCAVGDSLTAQAMYMDATQNALGLTSITNLGTGGLTLADNGSTGMCYDSYLADIPTSAYLITVMGGTNDWAQSITIGDVTSTDITEYCGALNYIIDYVSENYPTARLVIMCPPFGIYPNRTGWSDTTGIYNNNGNCMMDYALAAASVAEYRGIPCAKVGQQVGWNEKNYATFLQSDGAYLHPNSVGGNRIAAVLARYIMTIMPLTDDDV